MSRGHDVPAPVVNIRLRLPATLHATIGAIATRERRSVNAQIVYLLEHAAAAYPRDASPHAPQAYATSDDADDDAPNPRRPRRP